MTALGVQAARSATLVVADALHRPARSTLGALPGSAPGQLINPTHSLWVSLAGNSSAMPAVNLLVQFGEIAIGVCLLLSLATRFAALMGAILTGLLCVAGWSFAKRDRQRAIPVRGAFGLPHRRGRGRRVGPRWGPVALQGADQKPGSFPGGVVAAYRDQPVLIPRRSRSSADPARFAGATAVSRCTPFVAEEPPAKPRCRGGIRS
jgi:uncharacterized membrane protein YphA (DoxX/SURF4 family)